MKTFILVLIGLLFLTTEASAAPGRRTNPYLLVQPQIPSAPRSNQWIILTFPTNVSATFTVYQRDSLLPGTPWIVATNTATNSTMFLINKQIASRFFSTKANPISGKASVTLAWNPSTDPLVTNGGGYNIYYGGASAIYTNKVNAGRGTNVTISGLTTMASYFFAATCYSSSGVESPFSSEVSYKVPTNSWYTRTTTGRFPLAPSLALLAATNVMSTNAVLKGQVLNTGGDVPITMFFYGTDDAINDTNGYWDAIIVTGISSNTVSAPINGLVPNTQYYYIFAAINAAGMSITLPDLSFTTKASLALLSPRQAGNAPKGPTMKKAKKVIIEPTLPAEPPPLPPMPPMPAAPPTLKHSRTNSFSMLKPPAMLRQVDP